MEILLLLAPPLLFLIVAAGMIVVSQVSGWLTFNKYSQRQRAQNRVMFGYMAQLHAAKDAMSRRARQLQLLSARLAKNNAELENLNNLKTRFMSIAAHDMRTPIATIRGCAELLSDRPMLPKDKKNVQSILVSAENVGRLMSDLTDLSIIEAGKLRIQRAPVEAVELLSEVLATHGPLAASKGVVLEASPAPAVTVYGDRFRLGQALANLVGNAIKFTPAGGRVRVSAGAGGGGVLFAVTDTGPGIHPTEIKRIFEKFYQSRFGDPDAARKGWGLGLSIAAEIARAHGGQIGVQSPGLGKGARFWFFVPSQVSKGPVRVPKLLLQLASLMLALALPAVAQTTSAPASPSSVIPIDDKARYDKFLEEKADSVLLRMLGPNRAKVLVDSTLDFTRVERFEVTSGAGTTGGEGESPDNVMFAWQKASASAAKSGQPAEFLPGIPMDVQASPEAAMPKGPQSYERQYSFPTSFVKKLVVTIIIDKKITPEEAETIEKVVTNLLDVDPNRGDVMTVIRATFAPAWKTIWYSTDSVSMLFKYGLISLLALITLVVVAWCFVKLAGAIEAMAKAQTQQYAMDVGMKPQLEDQSPDVPQLEGPEDEKPEDAQPEPDDSSIVIEVKPQQLETLVEMLRNEDPENIALVCAYLAPDMRKKFMGGLPADKQAEVIMNMSSVRFVDEEMVAKIKGEIEQRLAGAVGGMGRIYDFIETAPPQLQRQLLSELETKDPELHKQLRKKVLMIEDLLALTPDEWSVLMGRTRIDNWAAALPGSPEGLAKCVEAQVLPQTWMIVSQIMESSGSTPEKVAAAQAEILDEARRLITEGKIHNPVGERPAELTGPAAPAAA